MIWPLHRNLLPILRPSLQSLQRARSRGLTSSAASFRGNKDIPYKLQCALPPFSKRMLDDGLLQSVDRDATESDCSSILSTYLEKCNSPAERHEAVVSFSLLLNIHRLSETACENCLYSKKRCICEVAGRVEPKNKLWVFQHHGEYGRGNNTGSLLCLVTGAKRTIRGLREQQDEMLDHISANKDSTVILFPTSDSITLDQYMASRSAALGPEIETKPLSLILLDGTSRQAKNLDRFVPYIIPRIRIGIPQIKSWLNPIRRQTEEHRVCTAQAAAMILRELNDYQASDAIENAVRNVVRLAAEERCPSHRAENKTADAALHFTRLQPGAPGSWE